MYNISSVCLSVLRRKATQKSNKTMADTSSASFVLPRPQSGDLSGSVFLIAANGSMLSLPIPSTSPRDPLNWSFNKRVRAFASMIFFSIVGLAEVQGPSLMLAGLSQEYASEVWTIPLNGTL